MIDAIDFYGDPSEWGGRVEKSVWDQFPLSQNQIRADHCEF